MSERNGTSWQSNEGDEYWRVVQPRWRGKAALFDELSAAGCAPKTATKLEELRFVMHHKNHGRMCYDRCSDAGLRKFVKDRGIVVGDTTMRMWCSTAVRALMIADDNRTFDRFLDLPAELRSKFYSFHVQDFTGEAFLSARSPPIARTSELLETEALPIFFGQTTHVILLELPLGRPFRLDAATQCFLGGLKEENISGMRHLEIDVIREYPHKLLAAPNIWCSFQVHFDPQAKEYTVGAGRIKRKANVQAEKILRPVLDKVIAREGMRKLQRKDFDDMVDALREAKQPPNPI